MKTVDECEANINTANMNLENALAAMKAEVEGLNNANKQDGLDLNTGMDQRIGDQIADIECQQVENDVFIVNDSAISVPGSNVPINLLGPWCVGAGKTIDFASQISLDSDVEEAYIKLLKNGAEVAIAGMDDSQEPSSFSLIYRETVGEDSEFLFTLDAREVDII